MRQARWAWVGLVGCLLMAGCAKKEPVASAPASAHSATASKATDRPKLMVVIAFDQLRADYLWRLREVMGPGGFRRFMDKGANYPSCQWPHFPTYTGPGHASLGTGSYPGQHGVVSNTWWDRGRGEVHYCVDDPDVTVTGQPSEAAKKPMGPAPLRTTTLGDELKLATGGQAKVVSVAMKDRAAILMAGRLADAVVWYDTANGNWVSSTAWGKDLPAWASALNQKAIPASQRGKRWEPTLTAEQARDLGGFEVMWGDRYAVQSKAVFADAVNAKVGETTDVYFKNYTETPAAVDYTFHAALEAVSAEKMGARGTTDLLWISVSSCDYVGHRYGPNSWEMLDYLVATDRSFAAFLDKLDKLVPGGLESCTIAVSADHGVAPAPKQMSALGFPARQIAEHDLLSAARAAVKSRFSNEGLVTAWVEPYVWLDRDAIRRAGLDLTTVQDVVAEAVGVVPGVASAWSASRLQRGQAPATEVGHRLVTTIHPAVSGDVVVVLDPCCLVSEGKYATSHGQPYVYDSAVPLLLAGYGIKPGVSHARVSPLDIAPTLAALAGVLAPATCEGKVLECVATGR